MRECVTCATVPLLIGPDTRLADALLTEKATLTLAGLEAAGG